MLFNKAMGLAVHNWKVMVKALVCQILILALIIALCYLIFGSFVDDVINVLAAGEWGKFLSETVESVANATFNGNDFAEKLAANIATGNRGHSQHLEQGGSFLRFLHCIVAFVPHSHFLFRRCGKFSTGRVSHFQHCAPVHVVFGKKIW